MLETTGKNICSPSTDKTSLDCDSNARCVKPVGIDHHICECKGEKYIHMRFNEIGKDSEHKNHLQINTLDKHLINLIHFIHQSIIVY